jgi:hypothetical protein
MLAVSTEFNDAMPVFHTWLTTMPSSQGPKYWLIGAAPQTIRMNHLVRRCHEVADFCGDENSHAAIFFRVQCSKKLKRWS